MSIGQGLPLNTSGATTRNPAVASLSATCMNCMRDQGRSVLVRRRVLRCPEDNPGHVHTWGENPNMSYIPMIALVLLGSPVTKHGTLAKSCTLPLGVYSRLTGAPAAQHTSILLQARNVNVVSFCGVWRRAGLPLGKWRVICSRSRSLLFRCGGQASDVCR